jgi:hypothetical protein
MLQSCSRGRVPVSLSLRNRDSIPILLSCCRRRRLRPSAPHAAAVIIGQKARRGFPVPAFVTGVGYLPK